MRMNRQHWLGLDGICVCVPVLACIVDNILFPRRKLDRRDCRLTQNRKWVSSTENEILNLTMPEEGSDKI